MRVTTEGLEELNSYEPSPEPYFNENVGAWDDQLGHFSYDGGATWGDARSYAAAPAPVSTAGAMESLGNTYSLSGPAFDDFNIGTLTPEPDIPVWDEATQGYRDKWGNYSYDGGVTWGPPRYYAPPPVSTASALAQLPEGPTDRASFIDYEGANAGNPFDAPGFESPWMPPAMQDDGDGGGLWGGFKNALGNIAEVGTVPYQLANEVADRLTGSTEQERWESNVSGNQFADLVTGGRADLEDLPYGLGYVTDAALAPATWLTAGVGPSVPVLGSTFSGNVGKRLAGEIAVGAAGNKGSEMGAEYAPQVIPNFSVPNIDAEILGRDVLLGDEALNFLGSDAGQSVAGGIAGGLLGGVGAYGGLKGLDAALNLGAVDEAIPSIYKASPFRVGDEAQFPAFAKDLTVPPGRAIPQVAGAADDLGGFNALVDARIKVINALNTDKAIRESGVTTAEIAAGRRGQVQGMLGGFDAASAQGLTGEARLNAMADAIPGGRLIKTTAGEVEVTQELRDALADAVNAWVEENPGFRAYDARTARDALLKVYAGDMPQPHEDKLLREILGDAVTERVYGGARGGYVPGAKIENPTMPLPMGKDTVPVQPPIASAGKSLTEAERGQMFFDALDAKRAEGQAFIERMRQSELPDRRQLSFGDEALIDATQHPGAGYDELLQRLEIEREDALIRRERASREYMDSFGTRPNNPDASSLSLQAEPTPLGLAPAAKALTSEEAAAKYAADLEAWRTQSLGQHPLSDTSRVRQVPGTGSVYTGPPIQGFKPTQRSLTPARIAQVARQVVGEAFALPRAIKSSLDLSAPLRQGAALGWRHPKAAASAFADQIRALRSPENARRIDALLDARPNARVHKEAGLYRAPWENANLSKREEAFLSQIAEKIPGVRASERAYATYLNKLRADSFDAVWNSMNELDRTADNATALARFVNVASGRGELPGVLDGAGPFLGQVLYSPRYVTSRPHMLWMAVTGNGSAIARKEAMKTVAAYFIGTSTVLALGKAGGIWDVELDPRSSDFGKGRVGPLRYDFWTGYSQLARLAAQAITQERKSTETGQITKLGSRMEPFERFTRSKLNPTTGFAVNNLTGSDYKGDPLGSPLDQILELFAPIQPQELIEAFRDYGWEMAAATLPGFVGIGTSVYAPNAYDKRDQQSMKEFGHGYSAQTVEERLEFTDKYGKVEPTSDKGKDVTDATAQLVKDQLGADDMLARGQMSAEQWRDEYGDRKDNLRFYKDQVYKDAGTRPGEDPVLDAYYAKMDETLLPNGKVDWDAMDRYKAALPDGGKYITDHTGFLQIDTPQTREFQQQYKAIQESGYFERNDENWHNVAYYVPTWDGDGRLPQPVNPKDFAHYDDWRNAVLKVALDSVGATFEDIGTVTQINAWLNKQEPAKGMEAYGKKWKDDWVWENPRAAYDAWRYGYYNPRKAIKEWLMEKYE